MRIRGKELAIDSAAGMAGGLLYSRFAYGQFFTWATLALPLSWILVSLFRMSILDRHSLRDTLDDERRKRETQP